MTYFKQESSLKNMCTCKLIFTIKLIYWICLCASKNASTFFHSSRNQTPTQFSFPFVLSVFSSFNSLSFFNSFSLAFSSCFSSLRVFLLHFIPKFIHLFIFFSLSYYSFSISFLLGFFFGSSIFQYFFFFVFFNKWR